MWTTLDGHVLRLPRSGRVAIAATSHLTGGRASLLRPGGEPDPAALRLVGRLARNAVLEGTRRGPVTGRRYSAFEAEAGGRRYTLLARPGRNGGATTLAAIEPETGPFSGEFSDGIGHRRAQNRIYDWLRRQGLQDSRVLERTNPAAAALGDGIRDNRHQIVGLSGPTRPNEPDISYPGYIGPGDLRRVNIEIDTTPEGQRDHIRTVLANDQRSMHIFQLVDPITGRTLSRQVWDPRIQDFIPNARPNRRLPRPGVIQGSLPLAAPRATMPPPPPMPPSPPGGGGGVTRGTQLSLPLRPRSTRGTQLGLPLRPARREFELMADLRSVGVF